MSIDKRLTESLADGKNWRDELKGFKPESDLHRARREAEAKAAEATGRINGTVDAFTGDPDVAWGARLRAWWKTDPEKVKRAPGKPGEVTFPDEWPEGVKPEEATRAEARRLLGLPEV